MWKCFLVGALLMQTSVAASEPRGNSAFRRTVESLDAELPLDNAELLAAAAELESRFSTRFERARGGGEGLRGDALQDERRYFATLLLLGEVSQRIRVGLAWADLAKRNERKKKAWARQEVRRRNEEERQRVYDDFLTAIAARRDAARDLWALATGRAEVVREDSYGRRSSATPAEARDFADRLRRSAKAPIFIRPATRTKTIELFSYERLEELRNLKPGLTRLGALVDVQLREVADEHLHRVLTVMGRGGEDRLIAISSLGWWNGAAGMGVVIDCLNSESEDDNAAAVQALKRLRLSNSSLKNFVQHDDERVRRVVAELVVWDRSFVDDPRASIGQLQVLMVDPSERVREAALSSVDRLMKCRQTTETSQVATLMPAFDLRQPSDVVLGALGWLSENRPYLYANQRMKSWLARLTRHREESVRTSVSRLLQEQAFAGR